MPPDAGKGARWKDENGRLHSPSTLVLVGRMTRLRRGLARAATIIATIFLWIWVATKIVVTLIGTTTVVDDYNQFIERLPAILGWLYSTPWWVPAGLATALTAFLIWLAWPTPGAGLADPDKAMPPLPASAIPPLPTDERVRPSSYSPAAPI